MMNAQENQIYNLLLQLEDKYLTSEKIFRVILEGKQAEQDKIELIDALCQTVVTSLNFGDSRRAVKYLALAASFCKK